MPIIQKETPTPVENSLAYGVMNEVEKRLAGNKVEFRR